jgi:hypothetical protein
MPNCIVCQKPISQLSTGRPKHFCSPACKMRHTRSLAKQSSKSSSPASSLSQSTPDLLTKIKSLKAKLHQAPNKNPNYNPLIDPYMPTQNDAIIHAIKQGHPLPFPEHSDKPLPPDFKSPTFTPPEPEENTF